MYLLLFILLFTKSGVGFDGEIRTLFGNDFDDASNGRKPLIIDAPTHEFDYSKAAHHRETRDTLNVQSDVITKVIEKFKNASC